MPISIFATFQHNGQFIILLENIVLLRVSQRNSNTFEDLNIYSNVYIHVWFFFLFHLFFRKQWPKWNAAKAVTVQIKYLLFYVSLGCLVFWQNSNLRWWKVIPLQYFSTQNGYVKFHETNSSQWFRKWMPQGCLETCGNMMAIQS